MQNNGFYAAMKTDEGVQGIYIDEELFQAQQERFAAEQRRRAAKAERHDRLAATSRAQRDTIRVLKRELKLIGMGTILYWGYTTGLVALGFLVPVLIVFQSMICFRAGRWRGHRDRGNR